MGLGPDMLPITSSVKTMCLLCCCGTSPCWLHDFANVIIPFSGSCCCHCGCAASMQAVDGCNASHWRGQSAEVPISTIWTPLRGFLCARKVGCNRVPKHDAGAMQEPRKMLVLGSVHGVRFTPGFSQVLKPGQVARMPASCVQ